MTQVPNSGSAGTAVGVGRGVHVGQTVGAIARPEQIRFADAVPKTRSGKIMRRLLKEIATSGDIQGDITTLEDLSVIASLRQNEE